MERSGFDKIRGFLFTNWFLIWIVILANVIFSVMVLSTNEEVVTKYQEGLKKMKEISKRVILLGVDGRVVEAKTQPLYANTPGFKEAVARTLDYYFIWDWEDITKGYTIKIKNLDDFYNNSPKLQELVKNFLDPKNYPQGLKDVKLYFEYLINLLNTNKLPEVIKVLGYKITKYEVDRNKFLIEVYFPVLIKYYKVDEDKWYSKEGTIYMKATGIFDPSKGNATNPLGLIITGFKARYVTKEDAQL